MIGKERRLKIRRFSFYFFLAFAKLSLPQKISFGFKNYVFEKGKATEVLEVRKKLIFS